MPRSEAEAASLLDTYLSAQRERDEETARAAGGSELRAASDQIFKPVP
ncbi:MAG TPA: hypothetical protein VNP96_11675 [Solirubrobacterales bacterium]|nr:hypothetical protein [Solirubrobacterales bacterium]